MPVINIDLDDGLPEVSFSISAKNLGRFMAFAERNNQNEKLLDKANEVINTLYESGDLSLDGEKIVQKYLQDA